MDAVAVYKKNGDKDFSNSGICIAPNAIKAFLYPSDWGYVQICFDDSILPDARKLDAYYITSSAACE